ATRRAAAADVERDVARQAAAASERQRLDAVATAAVAAAERDRAKSELDESARTHAARLAESNAQTEAAQQETATVRQVADGLRQELAAAQHRAASLSERLEELRTHVTQLGAEAATWRDRAVAAEATTRAREREGE
ncbi:MAG TPA: hypothetical protein VE172_06140, partial [Stackebrandtia sp.]